MTKYGLKPSGDTAFFASWRERKDKRKRQLEAVRTRRHLIYQRLRNAAQ